MIGKRVGGDFAQALAPVITFALFWSNIKRATAAAAENIAPATAILMLEKDGPEVPYSEPLLLAIMFRQNSAWAAIMGWPRQ